MSILFDNSAHQYVGCAAGTIGAVGTGSYTVVALIRALGNAGFVSLWSGSLTGTQERQIIMDTNVWYGASDFTGFPGASTNTWYLVGQSKPAGTNLLHWHTWPYAADGSGTKTHGDEASGTHGDGSTIAGIRIGDGDNKGNGEVALIAIWKRVLSDADFNALCGNNAQAFMSLATGAPDALLLCNVANPNQVVDATGNGANATTVVGSGVTGNGADPPSFNYSISLGASVAWLRA